MVRNSLLLVCSLVISFFICEFIVRAFVTVRDVGPSFTTYDPVYGKRLKKGFSTTRVTPEFTMRITTNADGFRGPQPDSSKRPLLFLGDSFSMGYGVSDDEEFPALVRKAYEAMGDPVPVINTGMGSNGNGRWLTFLHNRGQQLNPRRIVIQFYSNDLGENLQEGLYALDERNQLQALDVPPPSKQRRLQQLIESVPGLPHSYLVGFSRQVLWSLRANTLPAEDPVTANGVQALEVGMQRELPGQSLQVALVEALLTFCKTNNWPVTALLVDLAPSNQQVLEQLLAAWGITTITIPGRQIHPDLYYAVDAHWNVAGHRFAANKLMEALSEDR